jgi:hypothetical protein
LRLEKEEIAHTFVFLAFPPTCGISRSTPNGKFGSLIKDFVSLIRSRSIAGVYDIPPNTPIPPAFDTAAAREGLATPPMPARRMGCWIPRRVVKGVVIDILKALMGKYFRSPSN